MTRTRTFRLEIAAAVSALLFLIAHAPAATPDRVFPPDAVVDVSLPPYNAKPDDGVDDTAAIQRAITDNIDTGRVLFFPAGQYDLSDTLVTKDPGGLWKARITFQGQGREKVVFRLADKAAGFTDRAHPKALFMSGSMWEKGDSADGGGNKAFFNNFFDFTIDTGSGNAGAVGIEYAVSNQGAIEHVTIRSGDGAGAGGITLLRRIPGPGLIKDVAIEGFDYGIDYGDMQYGMTLEYVTLTGQRVAGIRTAENVLHIRHLTSTNSVPAIMVTKPKGVLTLLDSTLKGGAPDAYAIQCDNTVLLRNVRTEGYRKAALKWRGQEIPGPDYMEFCGPGAIGSTAGVTPGPLLPVEETPEAPAIDLSDWIAVGPRREGEKDDTAAIQRAFDSGKQVVYFINNRSYFLSDTVVLRGKVRRLLGFGAEISLGAAKEPFSDIAHPRPLIRIDSTSGPVFLENLFFNAQYPGEVIFENNTPATVVIRHSAGWVGSGAFKRTYRNTAQATGKVFVEDVFLPGWNFTRQTVWARQFNPENPEGDGVTPQVLNEGGRLWILGFKTEGPAPYLSTVDGGVTELLGAYNYVSATAAPQVPPEAVPYIIRDSTAFLSFTSDNFRDSDYKIYISNSQKGKTTGLKGSQLPPRGASPGDRSFAVPLYRSGNP